eukprot:CAMPEP_0115392888 /NCGR_PEP_ID=MMETSP0271-20121206/11460_1 /TAXON_ID=71861 /ORGANISM="Scrippsiella trochoidea, Strain CCMP3099" /LENGTH=34 /DNA_ID= /DNA_START= /DNA_END= /DNA_ORIENTATION=
MQPALFEVLDGPEEQRCGGIEEGEEEDIAQVRGA